MRINPINENAPNFKGALNNKALLYGLEKISEHGASFAMGASLAGSLLLRPAAISITPKTDEKNKNLASINSVSSGVSKFLIGCAITLPIENAVKKIDENPLQYLSSNSIKNLKEKGKNLAQSHDYKFATQLIKLSGSILSAIPKSIITVALIPVLLDIFKQKKSKNNNDNLNMQKFNIDKNSFKPFLTDENTAFRGNAVAKGIGSVLNSEKIQNFIKKSSKNDVNIARNISNASDILLTSASVINIKKSDKIEENSKNPLIYNNILSTLACILFGNSLDEFVKHKTKNLMQNFKNANKNNPKLPKYIEGINILRPTLIFALTYYGILPIATTFLADKLDKNENKSKP